MQGSDSPLSRSAELCNVRHVSENDADENSINKANMQFRSSAFKLQPMGDTRIMAVDLLKRIQVLQRKLDILQSKQPENPRKKKKIRRRAKQIPRVFTCMISNCGKQYGSQASLKNHRKIKHGIRLYRRVKSETSKPLNF